VNGSSARSRSASLARLAAVSVRPGGFRTCASCLSNSSTARGRDAALLEIGQHQLFERGYACEWGEIEAPAAVDGPPAHLVADWDGGMPDVLETLTAAIDYQRRKRASGLETRKPAIRAGARVTGRWS
jgi:hypothetical protein